MAPRRRVDQKVNFAVILGKRGPNEELQDDAFIGDDES